MSLYEQGEVYNNLVKLMHYRGVTLNMQPLSSDALKSAINQYDHVLLSGKRDGNDLRGEALVYVVMINRNSKYAAKSMDFRKLLNNIPKQATKTSVEQNTIPVNVIFVSSEQLKTHVEKAIEQLREKNSNMLIENYDYSIFEIVTPEADIVPKHTIVSKEEAVKFCQDYYTEMDRFPKIYQSDPQAVWLGLKPGMWVKIDRVSETAATAIMYRYCIKG